PAAALEGSKAFAKDLMARAGIPTARYATFTDPGAARTFARELGAPVVVKADGLAAGKGAIVCATLAEAEAAIARCLERREFGAAGATIVVEEFLRGEEASFFAVSNGGACVALVATLEGELLLLLDAAARGAPLPAPAPTKRAAVCVVVASGGYPGRHPTGAPIDGIDEAERMPGVVVFHAGTAMRDGRLVTAGGRVLGVTATAESVPAAIEHVYAAASRIRFDGMHYRRDIGRRQAARGV